MRVLLVDDEVKLLRALRQTFMDQQYVCDLAEDGETALDMARTDSYDLLIVDVMLPRMSGYELVRSLRKAGQSTPILLLTARDAVADRVKGLDLGADDYLVKPFATQELFARVRALTRRTGDVMGTDTLRVGDLALDLRERSVTVAGQPLALSAKEFQLLELFLRNPGRVLPKELILDRVWGFSAAIDTNAVEIYVHFLRRKLEGKRQELGLESGCRIETVRGAGYAMRVADQAGGGT